MAELCSWGPPAAEERLDRKETTQLWPVPEAILGQTTHFHLVNKYWELVLFKTVLYLVDKNGKYFSLATIISGLFIYYLIGCLP